jgi:hypothetical protein
MLEPGMVCAGIDKVGKPQLADIPEPLQCRGIEEGKSKVLEFDIAVDRVLDDLQEITKESSYTWDKSIE